METKFHLRARFLLFKDGKILITRKKGKPTTFLPGGHIEIGESAVTTIERETMEEIGKKCSVLQYLGAVEYAWIQDNIRHFEINHMFHIDIPDVSRDKPVESLEEEFEYFWSGVNELEKYNLHPIPLRELIRKWSEGNTSPWWGSAFLNKE